MNLIFSMWIVLVLWFWSFLFPHDVNNESPKVEILKPEKGISLMGAKQFQYKIQVSDKEDGQSKYDEISDNEVFLKVKFLKTQDLSAAFLKKDSERDKVFVSMKMNSCFNCHSFQQKLSGPSFREISERYGNTNEVVGKLSAKIISGSKGSWGDSQQMPAHPEFSNAESAAMAKLILEYGADKDMELYNGLEGSVKYNERYPKGSIIFIASYLDHGLYGTDRKEGKVISQINLN